MIIISVTLSLLFLITGVIYQYLGGYMLYINPRVKINRIFYLITLSLSIWALCFAMAIIAPDLQNALFWRRISSLGWGPFYALMAHFTIMLTRNKNNKNENPEIKIWQYIFFYAPALIIVYAYGISTELSAQNYHLIKTVLCWRNITINSTWDYFFCLYYIGYSCLGIFLLIQWRQKSSLIREKKQATLIIASFLICLILGSTTDIFIDYYTGIVLPECGVIFLLIPITVIWNSIKKYGLMTLSPGNIAEDIIVNMNDGLILLDSNGAIKMMNPSSEKLLGYSLPDLITQNINILLNNEMSGPEVSWNTIGKTDATGIEINVYTKEGIQTPVLFSATKINDKWGEIVGIICILSDLTEIKTREAALQKAQDELEQKVSERTKELSDVNEKLITEIEERTKIVELQKHVAEISANFIALTQWNAGEKIQQMLEQMGKILQADRAYVVMINWVENSLLCEYEWYKEGMNCKIDWDTIMKNHTSWIVNNCKIKQEIFVPNVTLISDEKQFEREQLIVFKIKSMIAMPIEREGEVLGFIGFDTVLEEQNWDLSQVYSIRTLAKVFSDGIAKMEYEKQMEFLAYHDPLTKLPNRLELVRRIEYHISKNAKEKMALIFIDIDDFKFINDTMGHQYGDNILVMISDMLRNILGDNGLIARIGGDEFVIVIERFQGKEAVISICEQIMGVFHEPFMIEQEEFYLKASAGVAFYPENGQNALEMLKSSDFAMYNAKEAGKNQYKICDVKILEEMNYKNQLIKGLSKALAGQEFMIYYQPQVSLKTGKIIGMEALLRWNSPEYGMISPAVFIPLAEQNGFINAIGEWVIRQVCEQMCKWKKSGKNSIRIAINLSVNQFRQKSFWTNLENIIRENNINPSYLEFEMTESVAMNEEDNIVEVLNRLKQLGVQIAIDDFGTDYSSLSRIKEIPIDKIKIDREFIKELSDSPKDQAIVKAILMLGKNLNLIVLAEGAETQAEIDFLIVHKCDEVQGYFYHKPMPANEIELLLD